MRVRSLLVSLGAVGVVLTVALGTAWACTNLATLNLSNAAGAPGQSITVTGSSFKVVASGPAAPVVLHWNAVAGPALATVNPDATGNISAQVVIPQAEPGYYVLVATQSVNGADAYGTPARAAFEIVRPGERPVLGPNAGQSAGVAATSTSNTGVIALTVALGVVGLVLFGAGATAFARQARRRAVPAAQPVERR
ncbi:MAG TPA: hypothetical protein VF942_15140 [Acidimicrobiales bacterium]|nr:hypothetical protein [Actinomycetota bacterium]